MNTQGAMFECVPLCWQYVEKATHPGRFVQRRSIPTRLQNALLLLSQAPYDL